jgi:hypothetical protein
MILEPVSSTPTSPLARWASDLRHALAPPDRSGVGASLAIRMLAQKALEVPQVGYEPWREQVLAGLLSPGHEPELVEFGQELMASPHLDLPARVAIIEVGTGPLMGVLAAAPTGSGQDYVVLVPSTFSTFAHLLAKSCALAVPLETTGSDVRLAFDGDWEQDLVPGAPAVARYLELLTAASRCRPGAAPQYLAPAERGGIIGSMRTAMKLFVIARHLATITMDGLTRQKVELAPGVHVESCTGEPLDCVLGAGLGLAIQTRTVRDAPPFGYWGIESLLQTCALLDALGEDNDLQALRSFVGPQVAGGVAIARYAMERFRPNDTVELGLARALTPVHEAFYAAVDTWLASRPAA